jgi:hypothetical protein
LVISGSRRRRKRIVAGKLQKRGGVVNSILLPKMAKFKLIINPSAI